jgi:hypothetical protein
MGALAKVQGRGALLAMMGLVLLMGLHLATPSQAYSSQAFNGAAPQILGKTYGEYSAQWCQWALTEPAATNPLNDTTGAYAGLNQKGPVWFLGGYNGSADDPTGPGPITRNVTIPTNKDIFFPLVNIYDVSGNKKAGVPADNEADMRDLFMRNMDPFYSSLICTLDDVPVVFNPDTPIVRTQSPTFSVTLGPDTIYDDYPPGKYVDCWTDGFWVMLPHLSDGEHILHFYASADTPDFGLFTQDITYIINDPHGDALGAAPFSPSTPSQANGGAAPQILGKTYGDWSAQWWQWALTEPEATSPLLTAEGNELNQKGPVWFLGGSASDEPVTRYVTIPKNKEIFFPIVNFADYSGGPIPVDNEAEWREYIQTYIDSFANLVCTLDGTPIEFNPNTPIVRTQSPTFSDTLDSDNIGGFPSGKYTHCWSDGYWVMLPPLSKGEHTLHFSCDSSENDFAQDVTYIINALPGVAQGKHALSQILFNQVSYSTPVYSASNANYGNTYDGVYTAYLSQDEEETGFKKTKYR